MESHSSVKETDAPVVGSVEIIEENKDRHERKFFIFNTPVVTSLTPNNWLDDKGKLNVKLDRPQTYMFQASGNTVKIKVERHGISNPVDSNQNYVFNHGGSVFSPEYNYRDERTGDIVRSYQNPPGYNKLFL